MCNNCESLLDIISRVVQNLYPKLQHQMVLLEMEFANHTVEEHAHPNAEASQVEALCDELSSLMSYDKKLVLPSILKYLENRWPLDQKRSPNISELLKLTQLKEERIFHLYDSLFKKPDFLAKHPNLNNTLVILEEDFFPLKEQYNKSVLGTLRDRTCTPELCDDEAVSVNMNGNEGSK